MNHITQLNALQKQMKFYTDFIPFCPKNSLIKLMKEILKINARIEILQAMRVDELVKDVVVFYETKQSKENFKTLKEYG